jgi:hypothetical protein
LTKNLIITILIILSLITALFLINKPIIFFQRATTNSSFINNSYIFASPIQAKADDQELIRITVFVLDDKGLGVPGKDVVLSSSPSLQIKNNITSTDTYGKAVFDIYSNLAGKFNLKAKVDNREITENVNVVFY